MKNLLLFALLLWGTASLKAQCSEDVVLGSDDNFIGTTELIKGGTIIASNQIESDSDIDFRAFEITLTDGFLVTGSSLLAVGDCTVATQEPDLLEFTVQPNPTDGPLRVRWTEGEDRIERVELRALTGKLLRAENASDRGQIEWSLHELPAGTYLLTLQAKDRRIVRRIVRQ